MGSVLRGGPSSGGQEAGIATIPDNVRHVLSVYRDRYELRAEWERRDTLDDFVIDGVVFTRRELMWVFKKLIQELEQ